MTEREAFEAFEAWCRSRYLCTDHSFVRSPDGYAHTVQHGALPMTYASVQMLWEAWRDALAAQPVATTMTGEQVANLIEAAVANATQSLRAEKDALKSRVDDLLSGVKEANARWVAARSENETLLQVLNEISCATVVNEGATAKEHLLDIRKLSIHAIYARSKK